MKSYQVKWEIDIDAESPEDAARQALEIQHDPESQATVFTVSDSDWYTYEVDLDEGLVTESNGNVALSYRIESVWA